ncbi:hypothetical protein EDC27_3142 [Desulfosoma caldarium]|uniref:Uncharacterized protein n=1 Tax=Desulfosoma caldarium TaxID=610254 RepID=A0A3N1UDW8_9BACT|nr:hypothetical protein EDC27_3142 [Desulfosoma caldarium]
MPVKQVIFPVAHAEEAAGLLGVDMMGCLAGNKGFRPGRADMASFPGVRPAARLTCRHRACAPRGDQSALTCQRRPYQRSRS